MNGIEMLLKSSGLDIAQVQKDFQTLVNTVKIFEARFQRVEKLMEEIELWMKQQQPAQNEQQNRQPSLPPVQNQQPEQQNQQSQNQPPKWQQP